MKHPKTYIIILNSNGWWDTIECLEPLQRITYPIPRLLQITAGMCRAGGAGGSRAADDCKRSAVDVGCEPSYQA